MDRSAEVFEGAFLGAWDEARGKEFAPFAAAGLEPGRVLEAGRIDRNTYSGFAFGLGLTRLAMMKFGVPDIRLFNSGDIRFYDQFPAAV